MSLSTLIRPEAARQVQFSGVAGDIIDALMVRTGGERLAPPPIGDTAGEYDGFRDDHSKHELGRLCANGLVHSLGLRADQLAHCASWLGSADEFVAYYCTEALAGLRQRDERKSSSGEWADQVRPDDTDDELEPAVAPIAGQIPESVLEWLERLLFGAKANYAAEYALAVCCGLVMPDDPGTEWARKARSKVDAMHRASLRVAS